MRLFFSFLIAVLMAFAANAEPFLGRQIEIVDRRTNAQPAPLIIAMNGFLGTAAQMQRKTSFDTMATDRGLVIAYLNGVRKRWNDGRSPANRVDDVGYIAALIGAMVADGRVDPARVFLAGHSNGGGMAMRMACDRPDLVAGIAVAATKIPAAYPCTNGRSVPAIFFYGTVDPVSPPQGRPMDHRLGGTLSADQTILNWSSRNGCREAGQAQIVDRVQDGTLAKIIQYNGCRAGLVLVEIEGHGHGWPGAGPLLPRIQGPASSEIDAAALSWWFFQQQ